MVPIKRPRWIPLSQLKAGAILTLRGLHVDWTRKYMHWRIAEVKWPFFVVVPVEAHAADERYFIAAADIGLILLESTQERIGKADRMDTMKETSFQFWQMAAVAALGGQASIASGYSDQGLATSIDVAARLADGLTEVYELRQKNFTPEQPAAETHPASVRSSKNKE